MCIYKIYLKNMKKLFKENYIFNENFDCIMSKYV